MTLFVNALHHLDAALWCPDHGLIGTSWNVDAEFDGTPDASGELCDVTTLRPWLGRHLKHGLDHTPLIPTQAPDVQVQECVEGLCVTTQHPYPMEIRAPRQALSLLPMARITAETLADRLASELMRQPPARVEAIRLRLREERIAGAAFRYSRALHRHDGHRQRIAHGYRSRLHIWQQGQRCPKFEAQWAERLDDRYLVDQATVVNDEAREGVLIRYRGSQGRFVLQLPADRCLALPGPPTTQRIATRMAEKIAQETEQTTVVQVFEGINRGVIAEASHAP